MDNWLDLFLDTGRENVSFNQEVRGPIFLTLWQIWKMRNIKVFDEKHPNPMDVIFAVKNNLFELSCLKPNPSSTNQVV